MTIRWLLKEGPMGEFQGIAALEISGVRYDREEVERIVMAHQTTALPTTSVSPAQIACHAIEADGSACAICRTPITQKSRGRRRKYCKGCVERLGHQAPASVSQENARKKP